MIIENVQNILVIRNDGIGDMISSIPAITMLHSNYPSARIYVLASELNAEILFGNPNIDGIIIDKSNITERIRLIIELRKLKFELVVVMRTSSWGNFVAYMSGAEHRVGRYQKFFKSALTQKDRCKYPKGTIHEVNRNIQLVGLVCSKSAMSSQKGDITQKQLVLNLSESEIKWAKRKLHESGISESEFLTCIHPGGSSDDKLWPLEKYIEIANRLITHFDSRIIVLHGPGEKELADILANSIDKSVVFAPQSLRHLIALLRLCNLVICNDSGPMHIAAALNRPVVAIFGPTDHIRWAPLGKSTVTVRQYMECWPCSAHKCRRNFECIKKLSEESVWQKIKKLLS